MSTLTTDDRRAYQANVWKSYLFGFLHSFQLWWPIWVIYLTDYRHFSLTQVSGLEALFWVVIVLSEVPTGAIADRFGRKLSLMLAAACTTTAVLVFGVAADYWVVLVSYVAWGFGLTFQSGADAAIVYESLKAVGREHEYQRVAGLGWGIWSFGVLAGLLLGAPLAAATNLAVPILVSAAIAFAGLLVAATFKEPDLPEEEERLEYRRLIGESARTAWRSPAVRSMLILSAVLMAAPITAGVFAQPFLSQHDVPVSLFGVVQAPARVAGLLGAIVAYRICAAFGFRPTLVGSFLLLAGSYVLLGGWDSVYAFAGIAVVTLILSVLMPLVADYLNQRIPNNQRATILSFRQLMTSIGIAALQPGLGVIADQVSLRAVFWTSAAFVAVLVPPALFFWLRADLSEEEAIAAKEVEAVVVS